MKTLTTWLLGGALAASLTWNWNLRRDAAAAAAFGSAATCGSTTACTLSAEELGIAPELATELGALCARSCGESDRLEQRANELQAELLAGLSAESVDEAATTKLVAEVAELRRRSLAACVQGILGVRAVLAPAQVRALLERCEPGAACAPGAGCAR